MCVPVAVWQPCELLYTCYLLTYLLTNMLQGSFLNVLSFNMVIHQMWAEYVNTYLCSIVFIIIHKRWLLYSFIDINCSLLLLVFLCYQSALLFPSSLLLFSTSSPFYSHFISSYPVNSPPFIPAVNHLRLPLQLQCVAAFWPVPNYCLMTGAKLCVWKTCWRLLPKRGNLGVERHYT